jgi:ubiquinone/menaquinone biosynthesis C-methylase UbiE
MSIARTKPRLLEIGPGRSPVAFRRKKCVKVLLDIEPVVIQKLKRKFKGRAHYAISDYVRLPFKKASISEIEARMPLFFTSEQETGATLAEFKRVLKRDGTVTVSTYALPAQERYVLETFKNVGFKLVKKTHPTERSLTRSERREVQFLAEYLDVSRTGSQIMILKFKKL